MAVDIVGRILQRAQLSRWLTAAITGQPVVVVLDGPPGVGKSTLVEWLVAQAEAQGTECQVVSVPESGDITPEIQIDAARIDDQLRSGLSYLVVIDDAQWLDETGRHHVEHLAFRLGTASMTGQVARMCLMLVIRDEATSSPLVSRLIGEPITRRLTLTVLDDPEARELARRISPGVTDPRTIARLVELSGGNPLTLGALADSISIGEVLPPPAATTGTIPVEVAWRARLATLSPAALRAAIVIALAEHAAVRQGPDDVDLLVGNDAAIHELVTIGAVRRVAGGVMFTHPLLRTTALDLATDALVSDVAAEVLGRLEGSSNASANAGTLVRLSAAAGCTGTVHHRQLVEAGFHEALERGSWSAAGDLAEFIVDAAADRREHALWLERLGKARFNELDRDDATKRLIEAAEEFAECARDGADAAAAATYRSSSAECLILALRTDFTRGGPRRHTELDPMVGALVDDAGIDRMWRARAAAILVEVSYSAPQHERRQQLIDTAESLAAGIDDPMTEMMVHFAGGLHRLATLDVEGATGSFLAAERAALAQPDPWWFGGSLARRAVVELSAGQPMDAVSNATVSIERCARISNWAEHAVGLAVRAVANTRLGRFADADNDTESTILSARRADSGDPFGLTLPTAMWRRAARGDQPGVAALVEITRQYQMFIPFPEFVATALLRGADEAEETLRPRWIPPRREIGARNIGFHLAQLDAAILAGNLEVVDALFAAFEIVHDRGVRASYDWPIGISLLMATAAIELGDGSVEVWLHHAEQSAIQAGSGLELALLHVQRARHAFLTGSGGQVELDQSRAALETLDALGAPLLARLHRERLTAVAGRIEMPAGRVRTVMFTDIVDSTRLMASAGNAVWAVVLGEHHRIVRSVVGRYRGSIMTSTGDGFSSWFEHPRDAVDAAHALHQAIEHAALVVPGGAVAVRVGLASGSVFDLGGDASGLAVAEAARVMSTATTGETHVSRSVIDHGLDVHVGRSLGLHSLKGLPKPVEVFELAYQVAT
ncbi:MAG: adenylate/guanylate cyclase domain-containing protein [Ilumatobacteraceae bacterium]